MMASFVRGNVATGVSVLTAHLQGNPRRRICYLCEPDILTARALGTMSHVKGHRLPLAKLVERGLHASRLMEEILRPVACCDEPEPFVADEPFDRAVC